MMVAILLLTYDRIEYARETMLSVHKNLISPDPIWMHIADDGSSQQFRDELLDLARELYGDNVSVTNSGRVGYGGNYNRALPIVHQIASIILPLEDDWRLTRPLDLTSVIKTLEMNVFNCIRLGRMAYTRELRARFVWAENLHWLELDPASSEHHVFAGGPRLETAEFERVLGPWPEGLSPGETELEVSGRELSRQKIGWPVSLIKPPGDAFEHIGVIPARWETVDAASASV